MSADYSLLNVAIFDGYKLSVHLQPKPETCGEHLLFDCNIRLRILTTNPVSICGPRDPGGSFC